MNDEPIPWMSDAKCAEVTPDIFFQEKGESTTDAKSVCRDCPVTAECLAFAQERFIDFGVFGGKTPLQRKRLRWKSRSA